MQPEMNTARGVWYHHHFLSHDIGELALEGCTVHIYDHDSLKLQTIHSTISAQLQQLKEQGLLSEEHQLRVSTHMQW